MKRLLHCALPLLMILALTLLPACRQLPSVVPSSRTEAETTEPETSEPETSEPETSEPETSEPETSEPETSEPQTSEPQTSEPQTTEPETTEPERPEPSEEEIENAYLTYAGLSQVSRGKNIILFILDRFDISYYESLIKSNPSFFEPLHGFTCFTDNISLYSRTFPAIPSMITGLDNPWTGPRSEYLYNAYQQGPFIQDLKENNFTLKLYIDSYYTYLTGRELYGVADNLSLNYPSSACYELNDAAVFRALSGDGLGLSFDQNENDYIFIHLKGCHDPYTMDANGNAVSKSSVTESLNGCFKMIYRYLDDLKRLGVFDSSTVIITGDHPRARDDTAVPTQPRLTTLFVKPAGADASSPLVTSTAQVSQTNLIPTLVASASLTTSHNWGESYFDIPEGRDVTRFHKFELSTSSSAYVVMMQVNGAGNDFSHWKEASRLKVGSFYK